MSDAQRLMSLSSCEAPFCYPLRMLFAELETYSYLDRKVIDRVSPGHLETRTAFQELDPHSELSHLLFLFLQLHPLLFHLLMRYTLLKSAS
jgi:hypothetical protein